MLETWNLRFCVIAITLGMATLVGCQTEAELNIEYGKILGNSRRTSLNGVSVFADMYKERGFTVKRRPKISPRIDRYDTLVWFPDRDSCPTEEATDAINRWLDEGYDRTLVYVGRDFDCQYDYLSRIFSTAQVEQKEEVLRRIAEARIRQDQRLGQSTFWFDNFLSECEWFEQVSFAREKTSQLSGPMMEALPDGQVTEVEIATLLAPRAVEDRGRWESKSLLTADGNDFAFSLSRKNRGYSDDYYGYESDDDSKIIVISNGSFLLNYALVVPANRQLAGFLIDQSSDLGDVLFLESGPSPIKVSDSDTTNHNSWAWIAEAPFRFIVPHFLMWGILFCFVFFPIFGRPRRLKTANLSDFRNHVNAIGKLMGRSKLPNRAIQRIKKYQQTAGQDPNRPHNET